MDPRTLFAFYRNELYVDLLDVHGLFRGTVIEWMMKTITVISAITPSHFMNKH
jgi:hypothetical protein